MPGAKERESKGLYTIVEQVDKRFLKDRFGESNGLLLKPSTFGVFRYLGEDWAEYEVAYIPKTTPTEAQQQRLIAFAKLLQQADDAEFESTLEDYLDVDQFLRFLAMNVLLSNLDSFSRRSPELLCLSRHENEPFAISSLGYGYLFWCVRHAGNAFFTP